MVIFVWSPGDGGTGYFWKIYLANQITSGTNEHGNEEIILVIGPTKMHKTRELIQTFNGKNIHK